MATRDKLSIRGLKPEIGLTEISREGLAAEFEVHGNLRSLSGG